MAKNRFLNTVFWDDDYIVNLDPSEKLVFLYCLTSPNSNICGMYQCNIKLVSLHTGFNIDTLTNIFSKLEKDGKIRYNRGWICIKNFEKHQRMNESIITGIESALKEVPEDIKNWPKYINIKKESP